MITRIKYLVLLSFVVLFNTIGFSQMVGTPYGISTTSSRTVVTFLYTGTNQTWTVPTGVSEIYVDVIGAQGTTITSLGGAGGRVLCRIRVNPGDVLAVTVGGQSLNNIAVYGGGGDGGRCTNSTAIAGAGGGLSAISSAFPLTQANALVVAGGGGGGNTGYSPTAHGGAGGGLLGADGIGGFNASRVRGIGANQTSGGAGGIYWDFNTVFATAGTALKGGKGGIVATSTHNGGGGGGAGYFGGGGGAGGGAAQGGGGGGSSWINPTSLALPGTLNIGNVNTSGHGKITIYY
ncbi:glycine-rich protein [Daejeonella sp.]|jgi:hypothetical protein|uniref:glycine-rich protein n=1 Tax=Daejeonella sp. TaxID=2805397 RepID=UPI0037C10A4A